MSGRPRVIQGAFLGGRPVIQARPGAPVPTAQAKPASPLARAPAPLSKNAAPLGRTGPVQAKGAVHPHATAIPEDLLRLPPQAQGKPLAEPLRAHMEGIFNTSFADVRIHEGRTAQALGAVAFTIGNQIHFANGKYQPDTPQGRQLLGHELAHVVQQKMGRVTNPLSTGVAVVQNPALEAEADRMGMRAGTALQMPPLRTSAQPSGPSPTKTRGNTVQAMLKSRFSTVRRLMIPTAGVAATWTGPQRRFVHMRPGGSWHILVSANGVLYESPASMSFLVRQGLRSLLHYYRVQMDLQYAKNMSRHLPPNKLKTDRKTMEALGREQGEMIRKIGLDHRENLVEASGISFVGGRLQELSEELECDHSVDAAKGRKQFNKYKRVRKAGLEKALTLVPSDAIPIPRELLLNIYPGLRNPHHEITVKDHPRRAADYTNVVDFERARTDEINSKGHTVHHRVLGGFAKSNEDHSQALYNTVNASDPSSEIERIVRAIIEGNERELLALGFTPFSGTTIRVGGLGGRLVGSPTITSDAKFKQIADKGERSAKNPKK